jgi:hypothetical protein
LVILAFDCAGKEMAINRQQSNNMFFIFSKVCGFKKKEEHIAPPGI